MQLQRFNKQPSKYKLMTSSLHASQKCSTSVVGGQDDTCLSKMTCVLAMMCALAHPASDLQPGNCLSLSCMWESCLRASCLSRALLRLRCEATEILKQLKGIVLGFLWLLCLVFGSLDMS